MTTPALHVPMSRSHELRFRYAYLYKVYYRCIYRNIYNYIYICRNMYICIQIYLHTYSYIYIQKLIYTPVIKHGLLFLATYGHPTMLVTADGFWPDQGFFAMLVRSAIFLPDGNPKNCLARFWCFFLNLIATNMLYPTTSSVLHDLWEAMLVDFWWC